ncbi:hypothetical protein LTR49_015069 [Elasticomyces elasticus]|nr:hypothetical protein LTR49_015069 [Elasticomyces elasticus]
MVYDEKDPLADAPEDALRDNLLCFQLLTVIGATLQSSLGVDGFQERNIHYDYGQVGNDNTETVA